MAFKFQNETTNGVDFSTLVKIIILTPFHYRRSNLRVLRFA